MNGLSVWEGWNNGEIREGFTKVIEFDLASKTEGDLMKGYLSRKLAGDRADTRHVPGEW